MRFIGNKVVLTVLSLSLTIASFGQSKINVVTTAVPFLTISGDSRSGGMGDVGVALGPDANGAQLNGAKMAFIQDDYGVGLSFTPWLQSLVNDIYLTNLTGFYKIKDVQTIHMSLRYFSLGNVQYTDDNGNNTINVHPNEFYIDAGYSRRLGSIASVGATLRFIYSEIAPNAGTATESVRPGIAGAADISAMVDKTFDNKGKGDMRHEILWGICISNIGSKMTYTSNVTKDFLPCNLGIGLGYKLHLDAKDANTIGIYADVNKLLVPTPNELTAEGYYKLSNKQANESPITGIITSFYDAPGGGSEEIKSFIEQIGAEYCFKKMFSLRLGYFSESVDKGGRQFMTVGAGIKYSVATLNFSYLVPTTNQKNPLDNTFSFSLAFQFKKGGLKKKTAADVAPTGDSSPAPTNRSKKASSTAPPQTAPAPPTTPSDPDPTKQ